MQKVIFLRGLPAAGKSTIAREMCKDGSTVRVNLDSIRDMYAMPWSKENERIYMGIQDEAILAALRAGKNVVVDNTHLHSNGPKRIALLIWECGFSVDYEIIDVEASDVVCNARNQARKISPTADDSKAVPDVAMRKMINEFNKAKRKGLWTIQSINQHPIVEHYHAPPACPEAIIVDVDGTLANAIRRGPYDFDHLDTDEVWSHVRDFTNRWRANNEECFGLVIICSGRDSKYRETTQQWLKAGGIQYDHLLMRPEGDSRRDSVIKLELFNKYIRHNFDVQAAVDDRLRVCRMWHQLGIPVLRCGDPDSDF